MTVHPVRMSDRCAHVVVVLAGLVTCLCVAGALGIRLNLTSSIPPGVYRVIGKPKTLRRGDIVLACLPRDVGTLAHARGYVPRGGSCQGQLAPVGKFVMALPGDTVVVAPWGMSVNGQAVPHSGQLDRDRSGRQLPRVPNGLSIVSPHFVWLVGASERSFDSRYFGPVRAANVLARIRRF